MNYISDSTDTTNKKCLLKLTDCKKYVSVDKLNCIDRCDDAKS